MSVIRRTVTVGIGANVDVNLSPFDRFAGRGGSVSVAITGLAAQAPVGDMTYTLMIGSDIVAAAAVVSGETTVGSGPTAETPRTTGIGAPADPITLNLQNANAAARVFQVQVDIQNA